MVPLMIMAVPPDWISSVVRLAAVFKSPPVTVTAVFAPEVIFVDPPDTITDPPETVTFERLMDVTSVPPVEVLPVTEPPVRLAEPD